MCGLCASHRRYIAPVVMLSQGRSGRISAANIQANHSHGHLQFSSAFTHQHVLNPMTPSPSKRPRMLQLDTPSSNSPPGDSHPATFGCSISPDVAPTVPLVTMVSAHNFFVGSFTYPSERYQCKMSDGGWWSCQCKDFTSRRKWFKQADKRNCKHLKLVFSTMSPALETGGILSCLVFGIPCICT